MFIWPSNRPVTNGIITTIVITTAILCEWPIFFLCYHPISFNAINPRLSCIWAPLRCNNHNNNCNLQNHNRDIFLQPAVSWWPLSNVIQGQAQIISCQGISDMVKGLCATRATSANGLASWTGTVATLDGSSRANGLSSLPITATRTHTCNESEKTYRVQSKLLPCNFPIIILRYILECRKVKVYYQRHRLNCCKTFNINWSTTNKRTKKGTLSPFFSFHSV